MNVRIEPSLTPLLVPIDSVHQHPDNPNHGDVEAIAESIRVNGFYNPIIVNAEGQIIAGNHRWQAMHALGATRIPAIEVTGDAEASIRRMLVDNKITRDGYDDVATTLALLAELAQTEVGLAGTGWDEDEVARMAAQAQEELHFGPPPEHTYFTVTCENLDAARDLAAELSERGYTIDGIAY